VATSVQQKRFIEHFESGDEGRSQSFARAGGCALQTTSHQYHGYQHYPKMKLEGLQKEVAPPVRDGINPVAEVEKHELTDFKQAMAKAVEPGRSGKIVSA
jgi:hypothetical protein